MKTDTRQRIVDFVGAQQRVSPKLIVEHTGFTPAAVFRHLSRLVREGVLSKQGIPPKVFYRVAHPSPAHTDYVFAPNVEVSLEEHFLKITPDGVLQTGCAAFISWCLTRSLDPMKTSAEYMASITKFDAYKKHGLIDGTYKLRHTLPSTSLDRLYYLDFYSIERFGKTKLGELILYAKQSQNLALMQRIATEVRDRVLDAIKRFHIDAVGFIPPTVKREKQFMKELERLLHLSLPTLKITKIRTPIVVPQKTLSKLDDRVENAKQSLIVEERASYRNILLIDDAVGSGATMNEVAAQIRMKNLCTGELIGLALTGSFSGFEVIQEV